MGAHADHISEATPPVEILALLNTGTLVDYLGTEDLTELKMALSGTRTSHASHQRLITIQVVLLNDYGMANMTRFIGQACSTAWRARIPSRGTLTGEMSRSLGRSAEMCMRMLRMCTYICSCTCTFGQVMHISERMGELVGIAVKWQHDKVKLSGTEEKDGVEAQILQLKSSGGLRFGMSNYGGVVLCDRKAVYMEARVLQGELSKVLQKPVLIYILTHE